MEHEKDFADIAEAAKNEMEAIVSRFKAECEELLRPFREYDVVAEKLRRERLDLIYKVILMSSAIVGFSATLLGTRNFSATVNVSRLVLSWIVLLGDIVFGFLLMFGDYFIEWQIGWNALLQRLGNGTEARVARQNKMGWVRQGILPYIPFLFYTFFIVGLIIFVSAFVSS